MRVQAFGLQEELVRGLVGELDDLVFDAGAVTRTNALDLARIHGRAVHVFSDDAVRLCRGEGDIARHLLLRDLLCTEAEGRGIGVARLHLKAGPVNASSIQPRRRSGLKPASSLTTHLE